MSWKNSSAWKRPTIGNEDVQSAVNAHVLLNSLLGIVVVSQVGGETVSLAAGFLDVLDGPVGVLLLGGKVADSDVCTLTGHEDGN